MNRFSRGEYVTIIVRNARTHIEEGRARFTDYEVEVKTNHMAFTVKNSKVRRRYSDFVWLRDRLAKDLMTGDPPMLPGRKLFGRFNTDFIKQRQRRLQDFLTNKMTVEEIEEYIDSKNDEEPYDTILSESAFKTSLHQNETSFTSRDRLASKEDSGIESCGHEYTESCEGNSAGSSSDNKKAEEILTDGNAADSEDNAEEEHEHSDNNNTDEDQLEEDMRKLRLTSLPSAPSEVEQDMESSVEYLLSCSSDSSDEVIQEDEVQEPQEAKSPTRKLSTGSRKSPAKARRRRRRRTCIAQFDLPESTANQEEALSSSLTFSKKKTNIRRCFSFERSARPFSTFEIRSRNSLLASKNSDCDLPSGKTSRSSLWRSSSSKFSGSEERFKSRFSGSEERFKQPVKRKISLNEYCIVKRDDFFQTSFEENDFNSSL